LEFGNEGTFSDEIEQLSLDFEWHGDDERHEQRHLCHQQDENLKKSA
jgi:hypothetical protein